MLQNNCIMLGSNFKERFNLCILIRSEYKQLEIIHLGMDNANYSQQVKGWNRMPSVFSNTLIKLKYVQLNLALTLTV